MRPSLLSALLFTATLSLAGCSLLGLGKDDDDDDDDDRDTSGDIDGRDADGDGYNAADDCDDTDADVHPDAEEICDEVDNDCDGETDEDGESRWYADADSDGYGDSDDSVMACGEPDGYSARGGDCDDDDSTSYPNAEEICDGVDNDCNGEIDDGASSTWYQDNDGDGYGDEDTEASGCDQPDNTHDWVHEGGDCNDDNASVTTGSDEVCDEVDNDCDGEIDEDATDGQEFPADEDGDGFGDPVATTIACEPVVANTLDCDDTDAHEPQVVDQASTSSSPTGTLAKPYRLIQEGIDNALQCVAVFPGDYGENIDFGGNDVLVFSMNGPTETTIDGQANGSTVSFVNGESAAAELRGFTVTGGSGTVDESSSSSTCGSGTSCDTYYYRYYGGGIMVDDASPTLTGLIVTGNQLPPTSYTELSSTSEVYVLSYGGGIFVNNSSGMRIDGVTITTNFADQGGGLYIAENGDVTVDQTRFIMNDGGDGAAMGVAGGNLDVTNALVVSNTGSGMGGALYIEDGQSTWWNVSVVGNSSTGNGGGVGIMGSSTFNLYSSIIYDTNDGEAVFVESGATLDVQYSDVFKSVDSLWAPEGADTTGTDGTISSDPAFTTWSDDGDPSNDDLSLGSSSPCKNTGNPSATYYDADGSRNDMGAYGGPEGAW